MGAKLDVWTVPNDSHGGTELKISHEMFVAILRACGGKIVVDQHDIVVLPGESIVSWRTEDPATFVWELQEAPEEPTPLLLPPERAPANTVWTDDKGQKWRKVLDPVGWIKYPEDTSSGIIWLVDPVTGRNVR